MRIYVDHSARQDFVDVVVRFGTEQVYVVNLTEPLATGASDTFEWPTGDVQVAVTERHSNQTHVETLDLRGGENHVMILVTSDRISVRNLDHKPLIM